MVKHIPILWEGESSAQFVPQDIAVNAAISAAVSGLDTMVKEGQAHFEAVKSGEMKPAEYARKVLVKGARQAAGSGSRVVAAYAVKQGFEKIVRRVPVRGIATGLRPALRSSALWSVAFGVVDQGVNAWKAANGSISQREYHVRTVQNAGATGGAVSGAAAGALVGNMLLPGPGALLGMLFGSMLGEKAGSTGGRKAGEKIFPDIPLD